MSEKIVQAAVPDGCFELISNLASALYSAVNAGKLNEADIVNFDGKKVEISALLDQAESMLSAAPTPPSDELNSTIQDLEHDLAQAMQKISELERKLSCEICSDGCVTRGSCRFKDENLPVDEQPDRAAVEQSAKLIMDFVGTMIGAYESGFVDTPVLTLGQLYQVARNHVKDEYGIDTKSLAEEMGEEFAASCNTKPQRITEQDAREIITAYVLWRGTEYNQVMADKFSAAFFTREKGLDLLAKLNENREPDYKAMADELLSAIKRINPNGPAHCNQKIVDAAIQKAEAWKL